MCQGTLTYYSSYVIKTNFVIYVGFLCGNHTVNKHYTYKASYVMQKSIHLYDAKIKILWLQTTCPPKIGGWMGRYLTIIDARNKVQIFMCFTLYMGQYVRLFLQETLKLLLSQVISFQQKEATI